MKNASGHTHACIMSASLYQNAAKQTLALPVAL